MGPCLRVMWRCFWKSALMEFRDEREDVVPNISQPKSHEAY